MNGWDRPIPQPQLYVRTEFIPVRLGKSGLSLTLTSSALFFSSSGEPLSQFLRLLHIVVRVCVCRPSSALLALRSSLFAPHPIDLSFTPSYPGTSRTGIHLLHPRSQSRCTNCIWTALFSAITITIVIYWQRVRSAHTYHTARSTLRPHTCHTGVIQHSRRNCTARHKHGQPRRRHLHRHYRIASNSIHCQSIYTQISFPDTSALGVSVFGRRRGRSRVFEKIHLERLK